MAIRDQWHSVQQNRLQMHGFAEKTKIKESLPEGRELATLSDAVSIKENNCYWICAYSRELEPRSVNGSGYLGRTFEGIPVEEGHYLINSDNTFTKLKEKEEADWSQRLYVSNFAASWPLLSASWLHSLCMACSPSALTYGQHEHERQNSHPLSFHKYQGIQNNLQA